MPIPDYQYNVLKERKKEKNPIVLTAELLWLMAVIDDVDAELMLCKHVWVCNMMFGEIHKWWGSVSCRGEKNKPAAVELMTWLLTAVVELMTWLMAVIDDD